MPEPRTFDAVKIHNTCYDVVQSECMAKAREALGDDASDEDIALRAEMYHAMILGWPSPSNMYH